MRRKSATGEPSSPRQQDFHEQSESCRVIARTRLALTQLKDSLMDIRYLLSPTKVSLLGNSFAP